MSSTIVTFPCSHTCPLPHTLQVFLPPGVNTHGIITSNMTEVQNHTFLPARKEESLFSCLTTTLHVLCARREFLASNLMKTKRGNLSHEGVMYGDTWPPGLTPPAVEKAQVQRVACTPTGLHRPTSLSCACLNVLPTFFLTQTARMQQQRAVGKASRAGEANMYLVPSVTGSPHAAHTLPPRYPHAAPTQPPPPPTPPTPGTPL